MKAYVVIRVLPGLEIAPRDREMNTRDLGLSKDEKVLVLCGPFGPLYSWDIMTRLHICLLIFSSQPLWLYV